MELALNLCWLTLLLPAYWLWHSAPARAKGVCICRLHSLVLLACVLILLFPVVSATDDLHVMRPEIEEPGSKRMVRAGAVERSSCESVNLGCTPALLSIFSLYRNTELGGSIIERPAILGEPLAFCTGGCRAPPASHPC